MKLDGEILEIEIGVGSVIAVVVEEEQPSLIPPTQTVDLVGDDMVLAIDVICGRGTDLAKFVSGFEAE